jgi:AcrR family transcriptional regulator
MSSTDDQISAGRERLIGAAVAVISERGYPATTVEDVSSRASVARATFYEHFGDLEDCLLAALDRAHRQLLATLRHASGDAYGVEAARSLVSALIGYASEEQEAGRLVLLEVLAGGPRALARRDRLLGEIEEIVDAAIRSGRGDRRVLALPSEALVGGTARLLAIRLHRGAIDAEELRSGLLAWIDAHLTRPRRRASPVKPFPRIEPPGNLEALTMKPPSRPPPRGRYRPDPGEVRRNQRERILYATAQAVYEYTYPATTVEDIIAQAGVSRRAFYRHFSDRQHAATDAIDPFWERGIAASAGAFFSASDWPRQVWAASEALTSFVAANPTGARLAFAEVHAISPAAIHHLYGRVNAFTLFLEPGYSYREQNRQLPRTCSEAIAAVFVEYFYRAARRRPAAAELPTLLPLFTYLCLAPFLGPDEATHFVQTMIEEARPRRRDEPERGP